MLPGRAVKKKKFPLVVLIILAAGVITLLLSGGQGSMRRWTAARLRSNFRQWEALETDYFLLRYPAQEAAWVRWWAQEADADARKVNEIFAFTHEQKPWLVLVPDQATIQNVFGWSDSTRALGVYQADTILLLSPEAWNWVPQERRISVFAAENPLLHEYTHFVLDNIANAFYPRWFSEGMAQVLTYHLQDPAGVAGESSKAVVFPLTELENNFDRAEYEAAAYRQAFCMVNYLWELKGTEGIRALLEQLACGKNFDRALEQVYALEQNEFFRLWRQWQEENPHPLVIDV
ncbi:MAG: hypothetical protein GX357_04875 [Firmicutes bacterium]|nr:hypothetical protein [Bacillota bacterium]